MKFKFLFVLLFGAVAGNSFAQALAPKISEKGEEVFTNDFSDADGKGWKAQFGDWQVTDGVLRAKQIPADNHGAAARQALEMEDGIFEMRFRLIGKGQGFHFGFDPKRGTLDKKGHLFSVIVSPAKARLIKHVNKAKPKEDPNEDLATAEHKFEGGKWHTLLVEKKGNDVFAQILPEGGDAAVELKATHPTFHVPTPTLVFRCIGDGVEIDDIKVWKVASK